MVGDIARSNTATNYTGRLPGHWKHNIHLEDRDRKTEAERQRQKDRDRKTDTERQRQKDRKTET